MESRGAGSLRRSKRQRSRFDLCSPVLTQVSLPDPSVFLVFEGGFSGFGEGDGLDAGRLGMYNPGPTFSNDQKCLFYHHSAIIEHVRDGSVVRALLLPDHYLVTVMLSGIKVRPHTGLHSGFGVCGSVC